jgi:hypothetical protein
MGVIPTKRKQGIGSLLFDRLVKDSLKINPTIELFANLGADRIYRRYGFSNQYKAFKIDLSAPEYIKTKFSFHIAKEIPKNILALDKEAMGIDRAEYLKYLLIGKDCEIVYSKELGKESYAIKTGNLIGPMIAKTEEMAIQLIYQMYQLNAFQMIVPNRVTTIIDKIFQPVKQHECIKMNYGEPIRNRFDWIWSYNSFAHG